MVRRAAILAASILSAQPNGGARSRELLQIAMSDLQWTYERRAKEWLAAPAPRPNPNETELKYANHLRNWERRKRQAAEGNVAGPQDIAIVKAAVRQYGLSFGPQEPKQVVIAMENIIRNYPNTPMATVAKEHVGRASALVATESASHPIVASKSTSNGPVATRPTRLTTMMAILLVCGAILFAVAVMYLRAKRS